MKEIMLLSSAYANKYIWVDSKISGTHFLLSDPLAVSSANIMIDCPS